MENGLKRSGLWGHLSEPKFVPFDLGEYGK